jgi:hypothetical protein
MAPITKDDHIVLLFSCIKNGKGAGLIDWNGVATDTGLTTNAAYVFRATNSQDHITDNNTTAPSATTNSPTTMGSVEYCAVALAAFLLLVPRIALEMKKESKQTRKKIRREQKERAAKRAEMEEARRSAR